MKVKALSSKAAVIPNRRNEIDRKAFGGPRPILPTVSPNIKISPAKDLAEIRKVRCLPI